MTTISKQSELYRRMTQQVAETMPEKVSDLDRILKTYNGSHTALSTFLEIFGSDNPWEAASHAVLKRAIFKSPALKGGTKTVKGVSGSGQKLKDQLFFFVHDQDPTRGKEYGSQSITKIFQAFGDSEQKNYFKPKRKEQVLSEKAKQAQRTIRNIAETLEDVLQDPSRVKDIQSRSDREKVHAILGLDEALKERLLKLDSIIYGNTAFVEEGQELYLLNAEPGGALLGRFKKKIKDLPDVIRDIYLTVTSPIVKIDESERKFLMGSLIAYAAANFPIRKEAVLGGYQEDLDFVMQLPHDHAIIRKYGKPDLSKVRHILKRKEITLIDATRVFDVYSIDKVRVEYNKAYLDRFQDKFDEVLATLQNLFIDGKEWREDSLGTASPMGRLKKSVYHTVLMREDFEKVSNALRLQTLATYEDGMYRSSSLKEFKDLVDKVVIAGGKVDALNDFLREEGITVDNAEDAEAIVKRFKGHTSRIPRGKNYDHAENFAEKYDIELAEFVKRANAYGYHGKEWDKIKESVIHFAQYGLYNIKHSELFEKMIGKLRNLVEYTEYDQERVQALTKHFLVKTIPFMSLPAAKGEYVEPDLLQRALADMGEIEKIIHQHNEEKIKGILAEKELIKNARFYDGKLDENISVHHTSRREIDEKVTRLDAVSIYDFQGIEREIADIKLNYVQVGELGNWKEKLTFLVNREAETLLKKVTGKAGADPKSWGAVKRIKDIDYVQIAFIDSVDKLYNRLNEEARYNRSVVTGAGKENLDEGKIKDPYELVIHGTTTKDKGRFWPKFKEFKWEKEGRRWQSRKDVTKALAADITYRLAEYNTEHHARLKVEMIKKF